MPPFAIRVTETPYIGKLQLGSIYKSGGLGTIMKNNWAAGRRVTLGATTLTLLGLAAAAPAAQVIFDMDFEFSSGTPPAGPAPWMRATFDDGGGSGSVTLKMENLNLVGTEFVRNWHFNLDPTLNPTSLVFSAPTKVGTFTNPTINTGTDAYKADGDGKYDIMFEFDNSGGASNKFQDNESVQYTITGIASLTAASFQYLSLPDGGHGPYYSASHVQGIGASGSNSGWVGGSLVPEPTSMLTLAGLTVLGLASARRRRK